MDANKLANTNASLGWQIALEIDRLVEEKLLKLRTQGLDLEHLEEYIGALDANKLANTKCFSRAANCP